MGVHGKNRLQKALVSVNIRTVAERPVKPIGTGQERRRRGVGGGGRDHALENREGRPVRNLDISVLETYTIFAFSNIFQIKWPKSEQKQFFLGRLVWVPINLTPSTGNFVTTPFVPVLQHSR